MSRVCIRAVTGTGRLELAGQEALYWRQLAMVEEKDELAKDFKDYLAKSLPDGVTGTLDNFDDLTSYDSDLVAHIKIAGDLGVRWIDDSTRYLARGIEVTWEAYTRSYIEHYG